MKKMNLAVGTLVLLGFILLLAGTILNLSGWNPLHPVILRPVSYYVVANTCFLMALIIDRFD